MPIIPAAELPIEQYHSCAPEWLSKTSIKDFIKHGPAWWQKAYILKSIERPIPEGVEQGSALDCYLTEGVDAFNARYVVKPPGMNFSTTAGKAWKAEHAVSEIITSDDYAILMDAVAAVRRDPVWKDMEQAMVQATVRRKSDNLGLGLQSRPDFLGLKMGAIYWDLKKTRDLELFGKQAINLGYNLQAAVARWCLRGEGIEMGPAYLVAVEWAHGARCRVYEIPEYAMEDGERQMCKAAADIADRVSTGDWSDVSPGVAPLEIPDWMQRKMGAA